MHSFSTRCFPALIRRTFAVILATWAAGPGTLGAQEFQTPDLIVTVVVDQLRQDVLDHYGSVFGGGLRRVLDDGYRFTQASHAHARTSTAPGHATISTGVFPSRHGVVANSWHDRRGFRWEPMYAVEDPDSPILGFENEPALGGRSPRTLLREGLPEWFAQANRDARRVSISKKDRAAVPLGGRDSEHVYWILPELGRFITSTYYRDEYPGWLEDFNEDVMPGIVAPGVWETEVPEQLRHMARADEAPYEGDGIHTVFPHVSAEESRPQRSEEEASSDSMEAVMLHNLWGLDQPRADAAVIELAKVAIDELDLGQRGDTDYLALSLSATDRVGHGYGPFSQEVFSTLIHLDRILGDLLDYLDEEVGEGRWTLGLTADHGVATMPEYAREQGNEEADRLLRSEVLPQLEVALRKAVQGGGTPREVANRIAGAVEEYDFLEAAYTHHGLTVEGAPADSFAVLYRNSYYPGRAWDDLSRFGVDLRYGQGDYVGSATGINHETPYWYDRHVPMIFLGAGVDRGTSDRPVYTVDFAPTLAAFAGIGVPDDLDGRNVY
ncbi:MAG: alkaline phosphatase family protein [Longimicrobiales bacterium]|nr:alkaline phosphatase family protein [Longimicrobiales bacterium]